jgi:hypothetical protein
VQEALEAHLLVSMDLLGATHFLVLLLLQAAVVEEAEYKPMEYRKMQELLVEMAVVVLVLQRVLLETVQQLL